MKGYFQFVSSEKTIYFEESKYLIQILAGLPLQTKICEYIYIIKKIDEGILNSF